MSGRVVWIEPSLDPRWDRLAAEHPAGQVWHTAAWLEVLRATYRYRPLHLGYERAGQLEAILPLFLIASPLTGRRLVSLPFSGPAGPLGWQRQAVDALVETAIELLPRTRAAYLNLQCRTDLVTLSHPSLVPETPFVNSLLAIGKAEVPRLIAPTDSVRYQLRRGRRRGVTVRLTDGRDGLRVFQRLYLATSRHHGIPPQPARLFEEMWARFAPRGAFQLVLTLLDERPIYGAICLLHGEVVSVVYAGTDYRFIQKYSPVRIGDWALAEWAREQGYRTLDLLQSHVNNAGLRYYKHSLGAREREIVHYYYPRPGEVSALRGFLVGGNTWPARLLKGMVSRLPEPLLLAAGSLAFRHVG